MWCDVRKRMRAIRRGGAAWIGAESPLSKSDNVKNGKQEARDGGGVERCGEASSARSSCMCVRGRKPSSLGTSRFQKNRKLKVMCRTRRRICASNIGSFMRRTSW